MTAAAARWPSSRGSGAVLSANGRFLVKHTLDLSLGLLAEATTKRSEIRHSS
jgi:hypothetical protein